MHYTEAAINNTNIMLKLVFESLLFWMFKVFMHNVFIKPLYPSLTNLICDCTFSSFSTVQPPISFICSILFFSLIDQLKWRVNIHAPLITITDKFIHSYPFFIWKFHGNFSLLKIFLSKKFFVKNIFLHVVFFKNILLASNFIILA